VTAPLVLVLTLAGGPADSREEALKRAVRRTLGPAATVLVDTVPTFPHDTEALALGTRVSATAVVEVSWRDDGHAWLHVNVSDHAEWFDRDLALEATAAPDERGRAVGFTIGTIVLMAMATPPPQLSAPPPPPPPVARRPPADVAPPSPVSTRRTELAVVAIWTPTPGALPRAGAAADVQLPLWDRLALDLGATTTVGHVAEADADSWMLLGCAGPLARAVLRRPFELDAVAAACVMREAYSRLGLTRANVAAAGKGSASGVVWVTPAVGVTLTADVTSIFAAAPIVVGTTQVAERPSVWLSVGLGARARF